MYYLYTIRNKLNNKIYVGKTNDPDRRWMVHKSVSRGNPETYGSGFSTLHYAMKKYGVDNFEFNVFSTHILEEEAYNEEKRHIESFKDNKIELYNIAPGGKGAGSGENHPGFGKPRTEVIKNKISEAKKGKCSGGDNANFGNVYSAETRAILSEVAKNRFISEERKLKTSQTLLSLSKEDRNIQFGENTHSAKLKEIQVIEIIKMLKDGVKNSEIAKTFNVHPNTISGIKNGKKWKHLER